MLKNYTLILLVNQRYYLHPLSPYGRELVRGPVAIMALVAIVGTGVTAGRTNSGTLSRRAPVRGYHMPFQHHGENLKCATIWSLESQS